jgi:N-acetyl-gamma-glutamylphosphate reductase
MDVKRLERSADKIIDAFADMRIDDRELMYVAMYVVIKAQPSQIIERVVEFGEQLKWEIKNDRRNDQYVQDNLF